MITMHTHQSSACRSHEAAWQGCAPKGTGHGCLRTLPFAASLSDKMRGVSLSDTQAISLSNPEDLP
jgi:hypothetical protein